MDTHNSDLCYSRVNCKTASWQLWECRETERRGRGGWEREKEKPRFGVEGGDLHLNFHHYMIVNQDLLLLEKNQLLINPAP